MSGEPDELTPVELPSGLLGEPACALPAFARLDGREVAIISEAEFRALTATDRGTYRAVRLSRIDKEPEVRAFIQERLGTDDVSRIREAAIERFGANRVPSRSAVNRFVKKVRLKEGTMRSSDG